MVAGDGSLYVGLMEKFDVFQLFSVEWCDFNNPNIRRKIGATKALGGRNERGRRMWHHLVSSLQSLFITLNLSLRLLGGLSLVAKIL